MKSEQREIKIKAWHKKLKCWIEFGALHADGMISIFHKDLEDQLPSHLEFDGESVTAKDYENDDFLYSPMTGDEYVYFDAKEIDLVQYTGLKDKNEKEIFEGDLLSHATNYLGNGKYGGDFIHKKENAEVVKFEGGCFCISTGATVEEFIYNIVHHRVEAEIIGNIYETELIK